MSSSFRYSNDRGSLYIPNGKDAKSLPLYKLKTRIMSIKSTIDSMEDTNDMMIQDGTSIHREQILVGRKAVNIRKVYLEDYPFVGNLRYKVGWVVDKDMKCCMICLNKFNWFRYKHHCRSCGYLICYYCSPYYATIAVFVKEEPTGSRVCKNCFGLKTQIAVSDNVNRFDPNLNSHPDSPHTSSPVFGNSSSPSRSSRSADTAPKGVVIRRRTNSNANAKAGAQSNSGLDVLLLSQSPLSAAHHIGMYNQVVSNLDNQHQAQYKNSYLAMRGLIPLDIFKMSVYDLVKQGLSEALATRVWSHRALWLICMHPNDIKTIHIADLRGKYIFQGLDLTEMRAIWFVLPVWQVEEVLNDSTSLDYSSSKLRVRTSSGTHMNLVDYIDSGYNEKAEWRARFKMKLDDMAYKEAKGTLHQNEIRNEVYKGFENHNVFDTSKVVYPRFIPPSPKVAVPEDIETSDLAGTPVVMKLHLNKTNIIFGEFSEHAESDLPLSNETIAQSKSKDSNGNNIIASVESSNCESNNGTIISINTELKSNENSPENLLSVFHSASYLVKLESRKKLKSNSFGSESELNDSSAGDLSFQDSSMSPNGSEYNFVEHELNPDDGPKTFIPFSDYPSPIAKLISNDASSSQISPTYQQQQHKKHNLFPISREHLIVLLETGKISTIESLLVVYFNSNGIEYSATVNIIELMNMCEELGTLIDSNTASKILLKVVTNPLKLQQPLLTLIVLVEVLHADVNITYNKFDTYTDVSDISENMGRSPIFFLVTHDDLGSYLMSKGADILQMDNSGDCSFYESLRLRIEWMLDEFEENGNELLLLQDKSDGNSDKIKRYIKYLVYGGYASKARNLISRHLIEISSVEASSFMSFSQSNNVNMKEPAETLALLYSLGSQKLDFK